MSLILLTGIFFPIKGVINVSLLLLFKFIENIMIIISKNSNGINLNKIDFKLNVLSINFRTY